MYGKLQEIKLMHYFRLMDNNNNGYFDLKDFLQETSIVAELRGLEEGSSDYERLKADQLGWWQALVQALGKELNDRVSFEEWIGFVGEGLTAIALAAGQTPNQPLEMAKQSARVRFEIMDVNGDGEISFAEYKDMLVARGGKEEEAAICFQKLDLDGNGVITKDEFVQNFKDFFYSNDPEAPGNYLYGIPF